MPTAVAPSMMTNDAAKNRLATTRIRQRTRPVIARTASPCPSPTMIVLMVNTAPVTQPGSPSTVVAYTGIAKLSTIIDMENANWANHSTR